MPFPDSPFSETFNFQVLTHLNNGSHIPGIELETTLLQWLCTPPKLTSIRVNTLKVNKEIVKDLIQAHLDRIGFAISQQTLDEPALFRDVITIKHQNVDPTAVRKYNKEVIVDMECAAALLRGAHIYAPGVMAMISGTMIGDLVSVYADVSKKCRRGFRKIYSDNQKVFIGNGMVKMTRRKLFGEEVAKGIAVEMTEVTSGCPPISNCLPEGWALLQNLPSILCIDILNPCGGEVILDMCAAPGHKTTHIAALMENQKTLVAIDKTPNKIQQLKNTCKIFGAQALIFQADSTQILSQNSTNLISEGPPFSPDCFDRILLDAPCSALGKRPQFHNTISEKVIKSYVPLQRKLFSTAVGLLKPKGTLVYSTCTITLAENEGIVAWALKTFECLELVHPGKSFGECGWPGTSLSDAERGKVQRFGARGPVDSVGFFIACFVKR